MHKTTKDLEILPLVLQVIYCNNLDKCCDHGLVMITKLTNIERADSQVFENLYDFLKDTMNTNFNKLFVVWHLVQGKIGTVL